MATSWRQVLCKSTIGMEKASRPCEVRQVLLIVEVVFLKAEEEPWVLLLTSSNFSFTSVQPFFWTAVL